MIEQYIRSILLQFFYKNDQVSPITDSLTDPRFHMSNTTAIYFFYHDLEDRGLWNSDVTELGGNYAGQQLSKSDDYVYGSVIDM